MLEGRSSGIKINGGVNIFKNKISSPTRLFYKVPKWRLQRLMWVFQVWINDKKRRKKFYTQNIIKR